MGEEEKYICKKPGERSVEIIARDKKVIGQSLTREYDFAWEKAEPGLKQSFSIVPEVPSWQVYVAFENPSFSRLSQVPSRTKEVTLDSLRQFLSLAALWAVLFFNSLVLSLVSLADFTSVLLERIFIVRNPAIIRTKSPPARKGIDRKLEEDLLVLFFAIINYEHTI